MDTPFKEYASSQRQYKADASNTMSATMSRSGSNLIIRAAALMASALIFTLAPIAFILVILPIILLPDFPAFRKTNAFLSA